MKKSVKEYGLNIINNQGVFVGLTGVCFKAYTPLEAIKKAVNLYPHWFESALYIEAYAY